MRVERHQRILEILRREETARVGRLAVVTGASHSTIRRDLEILEQQGYLQRVHGGAVRTYTRDEAYLLPRASQQASEKERIGHRAASMVVDGETIIITGGTTTARMIPYLAERSDLTIITNALNIAYQLTAYKHITVIVLGGLLRHLEFDLLGQITETSLQGLVASKLFRGIYGIHPKQGLTAMDVLHARTDQHMMKCVDELIILADHTKFTRVGTVQLAPVELATAIITSEETAAEYVHALEARGVTVIRAT